MIESILPFVVAFISLGAFELGGRVRSRVHVLMPWKDPVTLSLFMVALSPFILSRFGVDWIDPFNTWYLASALAFILCYSVAYIRGEFDMIYVNTHTIISEKYPGGAQEIRPIIYYYGYEDGRLYCQEQSMKEILKTVIFGIRSPLEFPMGQIQRTRPLVMKTVFFPLISVDAVDVVDEQIEEEIVVKLRFLKFKVRSYRYTPAPSCVDATQSWLVSAYNQDNLTRELTRKEAQLLESKVTAQSQFYAKSADLLVEMINDRTPGSDVYQSVINRFAPDPGMAIQPDPAQQPPTQIRRRKHRQQQQVVDDDDE